MVYYNDRMSAGKFIQQQYTDLCLTYKEELRHIYFMFNLFTWSANTKQLLDEVEHDIMN